MENSNGSVTVSSVCEDIGEGVQRTDILIYLQFFFNFDSTYVNCCVNLYIC